MGGLFVAGGVNQGRGTTRQVAQQFAAGSRNPSAVDIDKITADANRFLGAGGRRSSTLTASPQTLSGAAGRRPVERGGPGVR